MVLFVNINVLAHMHLPLAAVRPYLEQDIPVKPHMDEIIETAYRALMDN